MCNTACIIRHGVCYYVVNVAFMLPISLGILPMNLTDSVCVTCNKCYVHRVVMVDSYVYITTLTVHIPCNNINSACNTTVCSYTYIGLLTMLQEYDTHLS